MKKLTEKQMYEAASKQNASDLRRAGYSAAALRRAGYSAAALRRAGYSLSDLRSAGYSLSDLRRAGYSASEIEKCMADIPLIENPYTKIWNDIKAKKRIHNQSTWGWDSESNICNTPMCTAGHLVQLAGAEGWKLKEKTSWTVAATLLHFKAHPNLPPQNFGTIPQAWAIAYIKHMAKVEAKA